MIPLFLFIVLVVVVIVLFEIRERQRAKKPSDDNGVTPSSDRPEGCCGEHLVCEKESLLQTNATPEYYDDEELDTLAGIAPEQYTPEQEDAIRTVFATLQERDVPGWCRSLQLRNIALPADVREEALLIVREQRNTRKE